MQNILKGPIKSLNKFLYLFLGLFLAFAPSIAFSNSELTAEDKILLEVIQYTLKDDLYNAVMTAEKCNDTEFAKAIIQALSIYRNVDSTTLESIDLFLKANAWLPSTLYENKIEKAINDQYTYPDIVKWFEKREPKSPKAKFYYLHSKIKLGLLPKDAEVMSILRALWRNNEFDIQTEETILSEYKNVLTLNDCLEKIDNLSWSKNFKLASNLISILPSKYQSIPLQRLEALKAIENGKTPSLDSTKNHGDIYDYFVVSQLLKLGKNDAALKKMLTIKASRHPEKWWKHRNYLIRELLNEKQYKLAYRLSTEHGLKEGADLVEAEWVSGWVALRFMHKPGASINHFKTAYNNSKLANSKSKAAYWLARSYDEAGNEVQTQNWYREASKYPGTFYGLMSIAKLHNNTRLDLFSDEFAESYNDEPKATSQSSKGLRNLSHFAYLLFLSDQKLLAYNLVATIPDLGLKNSELDYIANYFNKKRMYPLSVELGRNAANKKFYLIKSSYPNHIKPIDHDLPLATYLGIIRQESNFDTKAISSAGAIGLMQLMPDTAALMAKKLNLEKNAFAKDSKANVLKGAAYVDMLYRQNQSYILTIASYNAGPGNAKKWVSKYGDPRKMGLESILDWIESVPFYETRNYIKKVIENVVIYENFLDSKSTTRSILKFLDIDDE